MKWRQVLLHSFFKSSYENESYFEAKNRENSRDNHFQFLVYRNPSSSSSQFSLVSRQKSSAINRSWSEILIFEIRAEHHQKNKHFSWLNISFVLFHSSWVWISSAERQLNEMKFISFSRYFVFLQIEKFLPKNDLEMKSNWSFYLTLLHVISLVIDGKLWFLLFLILVKWERKIFVCVKSLLHDRRTERFYF